MKQRTQGKIAIFRDHPIPATANAVVYLRPVGTAPLESEIALMFTAKPGSEQEANAEFIVTAWNSHELLVESLKELTLGLRYLGMTETSEPLKRAIAALAAAGAA